MYEKSLEWLDVKKQPETEVRPDTEESTEPAPLKELFEEIDKLKITKKLLIKSGKILKFCGLKYL